jgi:hypothetical protein
MGGLLSESLQCRHLVELRWSLPMWMCFGCNLFKMIEAFRGKANCKDHCHLIIALSVRQKLKLKYTSLIMIIFLVRSTF